jgi:hypothetical protein
MTSMYLCSVVDEDIADGAHAALRLAIDRRAWRRHHAVHHTTWRCLLAVCEPTGERVPDFT